MRLGLPTSPGGAGVQSADRQNGRRSDCAVGERIEFYCILQGRTRDRTSDEFASSVVLQELLSTYWPGLVGTTEQIAALVGNFLQTSFAP